jgi:hypothetical protein
MCEEAIIDTFSELRWFPSNEEIDYWVNITKETGINSWQRGVVTKFFLPKIGRVEHIKTRTLRDYVRMLLGVRKWLESHDFPILHNYMSAAITDGIDNRKLLARKKFIREFIDSTAYIELLGSRFATTSQSIIDSNVIIDMISAVHMGTFDLLPEFDSEETERVTVMHRIEAVAQEILRFISYITR